MIRKAKYIILLLTVLTVSACNSSPSELLFQGQSYKFESKKSSSGGKFDIASYSQGTNMMHLILPKDKTNLDNFAEIYTNTFRAQGFRISSSDNEHIGTGPSNIVYLTVSPNLDALSILLVEKTPDAIPTFEEASDIFQSLKMLK